MAEATAFEMPAPVARSPIRPAGPVRVVDGWERSQRAGARAASSSGELRLCDLSFLAKVSLRAPMQGPMAERLGVGLGRAARDGAGRLVVGSGPGEWMVLGSPGAAGAIVGELEAAAASDPGLTSVVDLTHGRALVRLSGPDAAVGVLCKLCALDFSERAFPDGSAARSSVAAVVTDMVRDDREGVRSYLLHCERSSGQYLFDALADAGRDYGIDVCGATDKDW